ncbi:hypothetical protein [Erwinia piriflorinigrans]|uniref:Uncharacterized protein n=1 Tax=Erwinia piriflorinigrans CFBP 5888 TaxID=1161919 RepID=V5ZA40_9GAMM|nr:hypothetical protein [Erwinia piriflorinigrans]CCG87800.1 hypothetical protein EPIR_2437 [Erwinia piriflorinigrans CFBP 5888]
MNFRMMFAVTSVFLITPVSIVAYAIKSEKLNQQQNRLSHLNYDEFRVMDREEMADTKGKVGPALVIAGQAAAGAGTAIANAYASAPNNSPNTSEVIAQGVGGFVAGGLNTFTGPVAASAFGLSAYGATQAMLGGGGNSECQTCHAISKP